MGVCRRAMGAVYVGVCGCDGQCVWECAGAMGLCAMRAAMCACVWECAECDECVCECARSACGSVPESDGRSEWECAESDGRSACERWAQCAGVRCAQCVWECAGVRCAQCVWECAGVRCAQCVWECAGVRCAQCVWECAGVRCAQCVCECAGVRWAQCVWDAPECDARSAM